MTISPDERRIIQDALQALSGVFDGANKQDTMGFNKFDSDFGKSLALQSMTTPLSDNQIITAAKMLKKYRNQLEGFGIHLPEELVKIASENKPEVWVEKGPASVWKNRACFFLGNAQLRAYEFLVL